MGNYINTLDVSYPDGTVHKVYVLDDDQRDIKRKLKATFPNIINAVTVSQTELNAVAGVTENIQTSITSLSARFTAIEEKGVSYSGHIAIGGTAVALPAGWSVVFNTPNIYRVTHNLGGTNYYPMITINSSTSNFQRLNAVVIALTTAYFSVQCYDLQTAQPVPASFYFLLHHNS